MKIALALARLVRLPLLFTALADSAVAVLLSHGLDAGALAGVWLAAAGLYIFGMAGNDVLDAPADRRRQQAGEGGRINPIVAGELRFPVAAVVALCGAILALVAATFSPAVNPRWTLAALAAIALYNGGAKRFPAVGLALLGFIRGANAAQGLVGADALAWCLPPAVVALHVTFLSAFAYAWEGKKPRLSVGHAIGLAVIVVLAAGALFVASQYRRVTLWPQLPDRLLVPAAAWLLFFGLFLAIALKADKKQRGPLLVFAGLSWLIVLDWGFALAGGVAESGTVFAVLLAAELITRRLTARRP